MLHPAWSGQYDRNTELNPEGAYLGRLAGLAAVEGPLDNSGGAAELRHL